MAETSKTTGRNEPCPCGSGRKYKQCCLEKDEAAARASRAQAQEQESAKPAAALAEAPGRHREPPARPATHQPWKRSQNVRGGQRFTAPRKVGGS